MQTNAHPHAWAEEILQPDVTTPQDRTNQEDPEAQVLFACHFLAQPERTHTLPLLLHSLAHTRTHTHTHTHIAGCKGCCGACRAQRIQCAVNAALGSGR